MGKLKGLFSALASPTVSDDDAKRRQFILHVLLLGVVGLSLSAAVGAILTGANLDTMIMSIFLSAVFIGMLFLSKKGHHQAASTALIVLLFIPTAYIGLAAGFLLPQSILIYAMLIVFAGVLLGSWQAWVTTTVIVLAIIATSVIQITGTYEPDISWAADLPGGYVDAIVISITLFNIALVSWLSNRELAKQQEILEQRVVERTRELEKMQAERVAQLAKFAELGRASSGLFHDLATPLSVLSLHLQQAKRLEPEETQEAAHHLDRALVAEKKIREFFRLIQGQLRQEDDIKEFFLETEITEVIRLAQDKAIAGQVSISFDSQDQTTRHYGSPAKFNKVILNLLSNAIESYEGQAESDEQVVDIRIESMGGTVNIMVADYGCGISDKDAPSVFDAFYSTKDSNKGSGLGLSICKEILESDFDGALSFTSESGKTTFMAKLRSQE